MEKRLCLLWKKWMAVGLWIGNIISNVVLIVFYCTVFSLVAIPYRLFRNGLKPQQQTSNWIPKEKTYFTLDDFKNEF